MPYDWSQYQDIPGPPQDTPPPEPTPVAPIPPPPEPQVAPPPGEWNVPVPYSMVPNTAPVAPEPSAPTQLPPPPQVATPAQMPTPFAQEHQNLEQLPFGLGKAISNIPVLGGAGIGLATILQGAGDALGQFGAPTQGTELFGLQPTLPGVGQVNTANLRDVPVLGGVVRGVETAMSALQSSYNNVAEPLIGYMALGGSAFLSESGFGPQYEVRLKEMGTTSDEFRQLLMGTITGTLTDQQIPRMEQILRAGGKQFQMDEPGASIVLGMALDPLSYVGAGGLFEPLAKIEQANAKIQAVVPFEKIADVLKTGKYIEATAEGVNRTLLQLSPYQRLMLNIFKPLGWDWEAGKLPSMEQLGIGANKGIARFVPWMSSNVGKEANILTRGADTFNLLAFHPEMDGSQFLNIADAATKAFADNNPAVLAPLYKQFPELQSVSGQQMLAALAGAKKGVQANRELYDTLMGIRQALRNALSNTDNPAGAVEQVLKNQPTLQTFDKLPGLIQPLVKNWMEGGPKAMNFEQLSSAIEQGFKYHVAADLINEMGSKVAKIMGTDKAPGMFRQWENALRQMESVLFLGTNPAAAVRNIFNDITVATLHGVNPWDYLHYGDKPINPIYVNRMFEQIGYQPPDNLGKIIAKSIYGGKGQQGPYGASLPKALNNLPGVKQMYKLWEWSQDRAQGLTYLKGWNQAYDQVWKVDKAITRMAPELEAAAEREAPGAVKALYRHLESSHDLTDVQKVLDTYHQAAHWQEFDTQIAQRLSEVSSRILGRDVTVTPEQLHSLMSEGTKARLEEFVHNVTIQSDPELRAQAIAAEELKLQQEVLQHSRDITMTREEGIAAGVVPPGPRPFELRGQIADLESRAEVLMNRESDLRDKIEALRESGAPDAGIDLPFLEKSRQSLDDQYHALLDQAAELRNGTKPIEGLTAADTLKRMDRSAMRKLGYSEPDLRNMSYGEARDIIRGQVPRYNKAVGEAERADELDKFFGEGQYAKPTGAEASTAPSGEVPPASLPGEGNPPPSSGSLPPEEPPAPAPVPQPEPPKTPPGGALAAQDLKTAKQFERLKSDIVHRPTEPEIYRGKMLEFKRLFAEANGGSLNKYEESAIKAWTPARRAEELDKLIKEAKSQGHTWMQDPIQMFQSWGEKSWKEALAGKKDSYQAVRDADAMIKKLGGDGLDLTKLDGYDKFQAGLKTGDVTEALSKAEERAIQEADAARGAAEFRQSEAGVGTISSEDINRYIRPSGDPKTIWVNKGASPKAGQTYAWDTHPRASKYDKWVRRPWTEVLPAVEDVRERLKGSYPALINDEMRGDELMKVMQESKKTAMEAAKAPTQAKLPKVEAPKPQRVTEPRPPKPTKPVLRTGSVAGDRYLARNEAQIRQYQYNINEWQQKLASGDISAPWQNMIDNTEYKISALDAKNDRLLKGLAEEDAFGGKPRIGEAKAPEAAPPAVESKGANAPLQPPTQVSAEPSAAGGAKPVAPTLTDTERQLEQLALEGKTAQEISEALGISRKEIVNLRSKLGIPSQQLPLTHEPNPAFEAWRKSKGYIESPEAMARKQILGVLNTAWENEKGLTPQGFGRLSQLNRDATAFEKGTLSVDEIKGKYPDLFPAPAVSAAQPAAEAAQTGMDLGKVLTKGQQAELDAAKQFVGKRVKGYSGTEDDVLGVRWTQGGPEYRVRDASTGEVRTHGTPYRTKDIVGDSPQLPPESFGNTARLPIDYVNETIRSMGLNPKDMKIVFTDKPDLSVTGKTISIPNSLKNDPRQLVRSVAHEAEHVRMTKSNEVANLTLEEIEKQARSVENKAELAVFGNRLHPITGEVIESNALPPESFGNATKASGEPVTSIQQQIEEARLRTQKATEDFVNSLKPYAASGAPMTLEQKQQAEALIMQHFVDAVREPAKAWEGVKGELSPSTKAQVLEWLGGKKQEMGEAKAVANSVGRWYTDHTVLNYGNRWNLDEWMNHVAPFTFWPIHQAANFAQDFIDHPAHATWYAHISNEFKAQTENDPNYPRRLQGKFSIPAPFLPGWAAGGLFVDPLRTFYPVEDVYKIAQLKQGSYTSLRNAADVLREMAYQGEISQQDAQQAIIKGSGPLWDRATQQLKGEQLNDTNVVQDLFSYHMPYQMLWDAIQGNTQNIQQTVSNIPAMRMIRGLSAPFTPGGINPVGSPYDLYYIKRALADMASEGRITPTDMQRALITQQGPVWTDAKSRAGIENYTIPYVSGALSSMTGHVYSGGELKYYDTKLQRDNLVTQQVAQAGGNPAMPRDQQWQFLRDHQLTGANSPIGQFYNQHPELGDFSAIHKEPETEMRDFLVTELWSIWKQTPALQHRLATADLGSDFKTQFLDKASRNYDDISLGKLEGWVNALKGFVPDPAEFQAPIPDPARVTFATDKQNEAYQTFVQGIDSKYGPGTIQNLERQYFAIPATDKAGRAQFRAQNPNLVQYWTENDAFYQQNPDIAKLLEQTGAKAPSTQQLSSLQMGVPNVQAFNQLVNGMWGWNNIKAWENAYYALPAGSARAAYRATPEGAALMRYFSLKGAYYGTSTGNQYQFRSPITRWIVSSAPKSFSGGSRASVFPRPSLRGASAHTPRIRMRHLVRASTLSSSAFQKPIKYVGGLGSTF